MLTLLVAWWLPASLVKSQGQPLNLGDMLNAFVQTTSNEVMAAFGVAFLVRFLLSLAMGMLIVEPLSWLFWFNYWRLR
jgi:hypothetical protein